MNKRTHSLNSPMYNDLGYLLYRNHNMKSNNNTNMLNFKDIKEFQNILKQKEETKVDIISLWIELKNENIQNCVIEILNRLLYLMDKHPCSYKLFGMDIDRSSIRDFIISIIATNIVTIVWQHITSS